MRRIDLNSDLGEGGPADADLIGVVTSVNVACGFHAGDPATMSAAVAGAAALGVAVGAHPSYDDRAGFGRQDVEIGPDRLLADLTYQIGALEGIARAAGTQVGHVKPHGALYNRAAVDPGRADVVARAAAAFGLVLLCPPGSELTRAADRHGIPAVGECFADRAYTAEGTLVPRDLPGAVLDEPHAVVEQALGLAVEGRVRTVAGTVIRLAAGSICVHGDTPGAVELARRVRAALEEAGVAVRPFA